MRSWIGLALLLAGSVVNPVMAGEPTEAGSQIYNGTAVIGATASLGGAPAMSAAKFPCRSCHGRDGAGGREGGVPPIRQIDLLRSTPARPAYDADAFKQALEKGRASDGRPLAGVMPRYALDEVALASLSSYLEHLPDLQRRGISQRAVSIGIAVPMDNASVARLYARMLQEAIDRELPGGLVHNRRIVIKLLEGTADAIVSEAREEVLAVVGLPPSSKLGVSAFTDQQVPVLFSLFPLNGDEDATIVRGMMADRQDGLRALADRIAADGVKTLGVLDSPECGGAALDVVQRFARTGVRYEVVGMRVHSDLTVSPDMPLLLLCRNRQVGHILASLPDRATVYGLANELLFAAKAGFAGHRLILAVQEASAMSHEAGASKQSGLVRHADLAARLLVSALKEASRGVTRTSLINAVGSLQLPKTGLDFVRDELNGTSIVGIIETGGSAR